MCSREGAKRSTQKWALQNVNDENEVQHFTSPIASGHCFCTLATTERVNKYLDSRKKKKNEARKGDGRNQQTNKVYHNYT